MLLARQREWQVRYVFRTSLACCVQGFSSRCSTFQCTAAAHTVRPRQTSFFYRATEQSKHRLRPPTPALPRDRSEVHYGFSDEAPRPWVVPTAVEASTRAVRRDSDDRGLHRRQRIRRWFRWDDNSCTGAPPSLWAACPGSNFSTRRRSALSDGERMRETTPKSLASIERVNKLFTFESILKFEPQVRGNLESD